MQPVALAIAAAGLAACSQLPPPASFAVPLQNTENWQSANAWQSQVVTAPDLSDHANRSSLLAVPPPVAG